MREFVFMCFHSSDCRKKKMFKIKARLLVLKVKLAGLADNLKER